MAIYNSDKDQALRKLLKMAREVGVAREESPTIPYGIPDWADDDEESPMARFADKPKSRHHNMDSIAVAVMKELVANGHEDLLLIKNPEVGAWWAEVVAREKKFEAAWQEAEAKRAKADFDAHAKAELINRLTPEEKRLLGL